MNGHDAVLREQQRQQALLQALWRREADAALAPWLRGDRLQPRGLMAYRANAGANAERALASTYPTVQALVGEESFAGLARACWNACPPERGDMACFGDALPGFIAAEPRLADVPYLADVARLEALIAQAECAADAEAAPHTLERLAAHEPDRLRFRLAAGFAVLRSPHPVVSVWRAHQPGENAEAWFEAARNAMHDGQGESALVWRQGWKAQVQPLDAATAAWCACLQRGASLGEALSQASESFAFEPWLLQALPLGWVLGVDLL
jgi:hypothetical protein